MSMYEYFGGHFNSVVLVIQYNRIMDCTLVMLRLRSHSVHDTCRVAMKALLWYCVVNAVLFGSKCYLVIVFPGSYMSFVVSVSR